MFKILDSNYIWVFLVNIESVLLVPLVRYMLCFILLKTVFCCTFWRQKILILWRKIVENLSIFAYLFCPKNGAIDFKKPVITYERLVVENCPTPRSIAFLVLYRLLYNISSHFNALILAWSAYMNNTFWNTVF